MGRPATTIALTPEDRATLTQRLRAPASEQRVVVRARIVQAARGAVDGRHRGAVGPAPGNGRQAAARFATRGVAGLPNGTGYAALVTNISATAPATLFAALNIATGQLTAGHYARRRRREFLDVMNLNTHILSRRALQGASFSSVPQLRAAIDRFVKAYNAHATPFELRKRVVHFVGLKHCYADLRS